MQIDEFSKKQGEILKFAYSDSENLICDGAVRSGKTVVMTLAFALWAMSKFDRTNFAICGKTVSNAERNILRPFEQIEGLPFTLKYKVSTRMLTIKCGKKQNYFYFFGGKDESSYALIQGITLAGVLFDEVALMPQSFVDQAIARTLSFKNAKIWFNCNPEGPNHWFYKDWLTNPKKPKMHIHFLMRDNPILGDEEINRAETLYTGVFYERYILGRWVAAEGIVFPEFAGNPEKYMISADKLPKKFNWVKAGYDLGGNKSAYALSVFAQGADGKIYGIRSKKIQAVDLRPQDVDNKAKEFITGVEKDFNIYVEKCFIDDSYYTIINSLNDWRYMFNNAACIKNNMPLADRPLLLSKLMASGKFFLVKGECDDLADELSNAVFDKKSDKAIILDDGSMQIDTLDSMWYALADDWLYLNRAVMI